LRGDFAKARDESHRPFGLRPDYSEAKEVLKKTDERLAEQEKREANAETFDMRWWTGSCYFFPRYHSSPRRSLYAPLSPLTI